MIRAPLALVLTACAAAADPAIIVGIDATPGTDNAWRFSVTLEHGDTGWDDYADGWRVEAEDGTILGERPLAHPHVEEQPFTRSQGGIAIPADVATVIVRASTSPEGWAEDGTSFSLPR